MHRSACVQRFAYAHSHSIYRPLASEQKEKEYEALFIANAVSGVDAGLNRAAPAETRTAVLRLFSTSLLYVFHLEPLRSAKIFSLDRRQQTAEHHSLGRVDRNVHLEATGCSAGERPVLRLPALHTHTCEFVSALAPFTRAQTCTRTHTIYLRI